MPNLAEPSRSIWILLALLFALNIAIYSRGAHGPYIVDDYPNLVNNDYLIIKAFNFKNLKNALLSSPASSFHRPLAMLSFSINYTLAGDKSSYHIKFTNLFIHILTGLGIFLLTINLLPLFNKQVLPVNDNRILLAGLLTTSAWLFHPLFVSTVLYAVQRMAMLSTLFVIYGSLLFIKLRKENLHHNRGYLKLYLTVPLFTCLAFFAKENGILLPGFLVLIELFCFGFTFHKDAPASAKYLLKILLTAPVVFVVGYLIYTYINLLNQDITSYYFTVQERLLTQLRVLWRYAGWLLFINPEPMAIYHDDIALSKGLFNPASTLISLTAWITIITAAGIYFKTRSALIFCLLWFLWGQILESTVLPLSIAFEHRNYLPGYGLILGLVLLFIHYLDRLKTRSPLKFLPVVLILFLLPAYTLMERVDGWQDRKTLTLRLLANKPNSALTMSLVAQFLSDSGDYENAVKAVQYAQQLDRNESSHVLAEVALYCEHTPNLEFNRQLNDKILKLPLSSSSTVNTVNQFRVVTRICHQSTINDSVLLDLYNRFANNRNQQLSMLAYYGIGVVNLHKGDYAKTIDAWERAMAIHEYATGLKSALEQLQAELKK